jgi:hypothetical protein
VCKNKTFSLIETAMGVDINAQNDEECDYVKAVHG